MTVIVCLDDKNGMLFGGKRQSRDIEVVKKVQELSVGKRLWMNEYSKGLFNIDAIFVDEDFLEKAEAGDVCFVENKSLSDFRDKIKQLVVFKWNRVYPSNFKFDILLSDYKLESSIDFKGNSHEKITQEVYMK